MAASLALLSYVPFEYVAKGTLVLCVILFVVDPIPPYSRLLALLATMVVATLTKWYRIWQAASKEQEVTIVDERSKTKDGKVIKED